MIARLDNMGFDGLDAGASQHAERVIAICDESTGNSACICVVAGPRDGVRRVVESGITHGHDQRKMAAAQTHALPDQCLSLVGVEHVGEDDDE